MIQPQVQWAAPTPLWQTFSNETDAEARAQFRQPQLLRFATDSFMDEFMATLNNEPERLGEWIAEAETWRDPSAEPVPIEKLPPFVQKLHRLRLATSTPLNGSPTSLATIIPRTPPNDLPFKLYQPAHMRFYLVTACLVCRIPGLPDRMLDFGDAERVTYVIRRLRPKNGTVLSKFNLDTCDEYALVNGSAWVKASDDELVSGEEQLPMFGVSYVENDGRKRRVLAAMVPVGSREKYMGAAAAQIVPDEDFPLNEIDTRKTILLRQVTDPWRSVITQATKALSGFDTAGFPGLTKPGTDPDLLKKKQLADDQVNLLSWYILLDLGDFLEKYLPKVWDVILEAEDESTLGEAEGELFTQMKNATYTDPTTGVTLTLVEALVNIREHGNALDSTTIPYSTADASNPPTSPPFPDFRFPLNSTALKALVAPPEGSGFTTLDDRINAALLENDIPAHTPPLPLAARMTTLDNREAGWFVIRCVFERPNCGPLKPVVMSEATRPFQLAAFFDPDAPARPIRISLPLDTTPAGLRKFDKNTAFVISDVLCGQMERMGNVTLGDLVLSVLPWPFHKDLPTGDNGPCGEPGLEFGKICSFSLPIITICALIILMIIVNLLDIIFHWMPFFMLCFPFPRFKAKDA